MIGDEHPQVIAIIMSVLEEDTAAELLALLPAKCAPKLCVEWRCLTRCNPAKMPELEMLYNANCKARCPLKRPDRGRRARCGEDYESTS
ncbi:MAG: hypothetical protein CM15mP120_08400 [Pseudomonadota bacterium]|nr:MAG: hypothetical protein CM15mP120_08400 [Pseudomonadota bacterium]